MKTQYFEQLSEEDKAKVNAALPRFKKGYKLVRRENALNGEVLFIAVTMRKEALQNAEEMEQKPIKNKTQPHYHFTDVEGVKSEEIWANAKEMYALELYTKSNMNGRSMAKLPDHMEPEVKAPQIPDEELAEFLKWKEMEAEKEAKKQAAAKEKAEQKAKEKAEKEAAKKPTDNA